MSDQPQQNTDRELWRDDWQGSIFVTERGSIGINVGGHVIVKPLRDWHKAFADAIKVGFDETGMRDARAAIAAMEGEGEKPDPIEDDDPSRADEDWFFDHDGKP